MRMRDNVLRIKPTKAVALKSHPCAVGPRKSLEILGSCHDGVVCVLPWLGLSIVDVDQKDHIPMANKPRDVDLPAIGGTLGGLVLVELLRPFFVIMDDGWILL